MLLYIDLKQTIDCEAYVPEGPVDAISHQMNDAGPCMEFVQLNASRLAALKQSAGNIAERQEPDEDPRCRRSGTD